jgi:predicted Zn-dependent protease
MLRLSHPPENHPQNVRRVLDAADGYLYLGLPAEALAEIERLSAADQDNNALLRMRIRVLLHLHRWQEAQRIAALGASIYPGEEEFTVQRAFALHMLRRPREAARVLQSAPEWLRRTGVLHYNLACYEVRFGDLDSARECIATACEMNEAFRRNLGTDPDLAPLNA